MKLHLVSDELHSSDRPKLGLGYLASYLRKNNPGIELSLSFASDDLKADLQREKPDIVGFSSMTHAFKMQTEKAKMVKDKFGLPIIFGGVHISLTPNALPKFVDVGVISEGEEVLSRLLRDYQKGLAFAKASVGKLKNKKISSLVFWEKDKLVVTGPPLLVEPIDKIPSPDWDFLRVGKNGPGHIMTSRGCPYRCRFCEAGNFWKKYRAHSAEYVVEEVEKIYKRYGRGELVIMDDLFFVNKVRLEKITDLLEGKGLSKKMRFEVIGRADLFNEEIVRILKRMNVFAISFGMESGSERILRYLKNETVTLEQIRKATLLAKKYKMQVLGTFMVGTPGETEEDIRKTIEFIKELDLDQVGVNVTTPFPGTQLWEEAKKKGLVKEDLWDDRLWAMRDVNDGNVNDKLLLTDLSREKFWKLAKEMFALQDWTHRRRRNQQLFREFKKEKSPVQLLKFIAHSFKRPKETLYNFKHGGF
ncbi:MAG: radical SAM protein [bacterium]|nr:radical SAM protein [bacterium]